MPYRAAPPTASLRRWVRELSWSAEPIEPFTAHRILPDGGVDLLVTLSADAGSCRTELFGPKSVALVVHDDRPLEKWAAHLRPGAFARLFGVPAAELRDRVLPLAELWGEADSVRLAEAIAAAPDFASATETLEAALRGALEHRPGETPLVSLVECAIARIRAARGALSLVGLARSLHTTPRTLERAFATHVGLSPKRFARAVRLGHAVSALRAGRPAAEVAAALCYSDQPHLVRELRELAGASATELRKLD